MFKFTRVGRAVGALALIAALGVTLVQSFTVSLQGLTKSQHDAIDELRSRVINDLPPNHEYMKSDVFLLRWLTAKNFDVSKAQEFLMENLVWREKENIDGILKEDWTEFLRDFPYTIDKVDKQGRPIVYFKFGDWDIRAVGVSGMLKKLNRYFARMFEDAEQKIWSMRANGSNVTQFHLILNMDGFNTVQHACLQCLPFYATLGRTMEASYPGTADKVFMVNTPGGFSLILRLLTSVLSRQARDTLKVYGTDRKEWEPVLLEIINRDQLPADLQ